MVKNTKGGNHKNQARKHLCSYERKLRLKTDPCEMYALVTIKPGGNKIVVLCLDNVTRLCTIPGKFNRGRDNVVEKGSWVLIGLRDWETPKKRENCDLLEVYNENEKQKLFTTINENWKVFETKKIESDVVDFTNEYEEQQAQIESEIIASSQSVVMNHELIDFNVI
jgi:translation initiation factor IF-1